MIRNWRTAATATLAAGLAACSVGPQYKPPEAPRAPDYGAAPAAGSVLAPEEGAASAQRFVAGMDIPGEWWQLFGSAKLSGLIEDALKANPNIAAAQAALKQAHELSAVQWAALLPTVQASFSAQRAKNPSATIAPPTVATDPVYSLYTPQLTLSYSADVFGATRRSVEAARAQEQASKFQLEATYLTLSSSVVVTAVQEASLRGQISATERLLQLQHELTENIRSRRSLGTASELDLLTQQSAEAQTAATLPPLRKQLWQTRDALTALLGRLPSDEPKETFDLGELTLPQELPISLPSELVRQRPDVRQAEENLHAATAEVGVAVAGLLPQFSINAQTGSSAFDVGRLFSPYTAFWSAGASLSQTLFDGGALLHRRRAAEAALDAAAAQYRSTVILAFQNVADTLRALQADADAVKASLDADRAAWETLQTARRQYQLGTISFVAVMTTEQAYQQAELALVQARASRYADTAALFQALGGGWWNRPGEVLDEQSGSKVR